MYPSLKIYREAYSGDAWPLKSLDGNVVQEDTQLVLRLDIGIDWYQPSRTNHARTQSVGPLIGHVTNLPLKLRGSLPISLLLGITPGPSEIRGEHLHHYLLPLCVELRQARLAGITIITPKYPEGRLIYVALGAICCDGPARVGITGGPNFNLMGQFCIRCTVVKRDLLQPSTCVFRDRTAFQSTSKVYAERRVFRSRLKQEEEAFERSNHCIRDIVGIEIPEFPLESRIKLAALTCKTPGYITALDIVPLFDRQLATTYDPMHMLCIGVIKNAFKNIMYTGDKYHRVNPSGIQDVDTTATTSSSGSSGAIDELSRAKDEDLVESESSDEDSLANETQPGAPSTSVVLTQRKKKTARKKTAKAPAKKAPAPPKSTTKRKPEPLLSDSQKILFHTLLKEVILPPEVDGIAAATFFMPSSGTATASQWRTFARHFAPFVTIEVWTRNAALESVGSYNYNAEMREEDLRMLLRVSQITEMALRPVISNEQLRILRHYIKTFQDLVLKERPTIIRCPNIHWLSHLPDDIQRYGPVSSWALWVYERTNKSLKGANSNGHASDTAVIAFHKFLRLGALEILSTNETGKEDSASAFLAKASNSAFQAAIASVNLIEEQKEVLAWHEELRTSQQQNHRLRPTIISVKKHIVHSIPIIYVADVCTAWNADQSSTIKLQTIGGTNESARPLQSAATYFLSFRIGRNHFRTAPPSFTHRKGLSDDDFSKLRGSFFEWRNDAQVLSCASRRAPIGLIVSMFEASAIGTNGKLIEKQFLKIQLLEPFEGPDPYQFHERLPYMNIWLWKATFTRTQLMLVVPEWMDCLRPVVIKPLFSIPNDKKSPRIWAFKAITYT